MATPEFGTEICTFRPCTKLVLLVLAPLAVTGCAAPAIVPPVVATVAPIMAFVPPPILSIEDLRRLNILRKDRDANDRAFGRNTKE
jgi:hypothetical protein